MTILSIVLDSTTFYICIPQGSFGRMATLKKLSDGLIASNALVSRFTLSTNTSHSVYTIKSHGKMWICK